MHLVFDFDGTITQQDTIGVLASSAIDYQQHRNQIDLQPDWDQVVKSYMDDYKRYHSEHPVPEEERKTVDEELRFLSGMKHVEEASLQRIASCRVFGGMDATDLKQAGRDAVSSSKVKLRAGFGDLMGVAKARGWETSVISVNWSRAFIEGVLDPHEMRIVANEPHADGTILGPGFLGGGRMTNGHEKREALKHVVTGSEGRVVYFGDSTTDMECLLQGGIVISNDEGSSLMRTLRRVGQAVPHVKECEGNGGKGEGEGESEASLMWARDFHEVLESGVLPNN